MGKAITLKYAIWIALVFGAFAYSLRLGGPSPLWSSDTINDEKFVVSCLDFGACYWFGMGTSVEWVQHGANFLHLKTLVRALGGSDTTFHWLLHAAFAIALLLGYVTATRLGLNLCAPIVPLLTLGLLVWTQMQMDVTYNHRILPLLGILVVLLSVRAVMYSRGRELALAAVVAAIATNIHGQCMPFALSVPLLAFIFPQKCFRMFFTSTLVLFGTSFLTSPSTWFHNLAALLSRHGISSTSLSAPNIVGVVGLLCALFVSLLVWKKVLDKRFLVLPILATPKVLLTESFLLAGLIEPEAKYYIEVAPLGALLATTALYSALKSLPAKLREKLDDKPFAMLAALVIAIFPVAKAPQRPLSMLSDAEARALEHFLRHDLGLNHSAAVLALRGPLADDALDLIVNVRPLPWEPPTKVLQVTFAKTLLALVPNPLPKGFRMLHKDQGKALVAEVDEPFIDLTSFEVCVYPRSRPHEPQQCSKTGLGGPSSQGQVSTAVPGFPPIKRGQDINMLTTVALRYALKEGEAIEVLMPRLGNICNGRIVQVSGCSSRIYDQGQRAEINGPCDPKATLTFEFALGTSDCRDWAYRGTLPFFVIGQKAAVHIWETLLQPLSIETSSQTGGVP